MERAIDALGQESGCALTTGWETLLDHLSVLGNLLITKRSSGSTGYPGSQWHDIKPTHFTNSSNAKRELVWKCPAGIYQERYIPRELLYDMAIFRMKNGQFRLSPRNFIAF